MMLDAGCWRVEVDAGALSYLPSGRDLKRVRTYGRLSQSQAKDEEDDMDGERQRTRHTQDREETWYNQQHKMENWILEGTEMTG